MRPVPANTHRNEGKRPAKASGEKVVCCCGCWLQAATDNIERCEDFQHAFFRAFFRRRGRVAFFPPFFRGVQHVSNGGETLEFVAFFRIQRGAAVTAWNTARGARLYSQIKAFAFFRGFKVCALFWNLLYLCRVMCAAPLFAYMALYLFFV